MQTPAAPSQWSGIRAVSVSEKLELRLGALHFAGVNLPAVKQEQKHEHLMIQTPSSALPADDEVLLTPRQTADLLGLRESTLAQYRHAGDHPLKFCRLNHQVVRYRVGDIRQFLRSRTVQPDRAPPASGEARADLPARLLEVANEIRNVCAPPPENKLKGYNRRLFEQRYFMRQEDQIYEILRREGERDSRAFLPLAALAQECMRAGMHQRFAVRSAFAKDGGTQKWAYAKPKRAKKWIDASLAAYHAEIQSLKRRLKESVESDRNFDSAAACALQLIDFEAALGVRQAALVELAERELAAGGQPAVWFREQLSGKTISAGSRS